MRRLCLSLMGWEIELFMLLVILGFLVKKLWELQHYIVMILGW